MAVKKARKVVRRRRKSGLGYATDRHRRLGDDKVEQVRDEAEAAIELIKAGECDRAFSFAASANMLRGEANTHFLASHRGWSKPKIIDEMNKAFRRVCVVKK